ncbi:MAG: flagellar biosynthetic protein FliR [Lachnospiraceae bacterium]|nr:flagellar biosynthetic protein FliR [Lachnospiraceae bacterium]
MVDLSFSMTELEYFLLIVVRVTVFIYAAPFFGMANTPNRVKIAMGVLISALLYRIVPITELPYNTVLMYSVIVLKEAITGVLIGFGAGICTSILNFAGQMVDMETGLSMVSLMDPVSRDSVTITGTYYQYGVMLLLLISGMYQFVLGALTESFKLIPVNGAIFNSEKLLASISVFLVDYLVMGFRICLPVFASMLLLNTILGILAKVSPQLNMFAVGIQLKILVGIAVMFITVGLLPGISNMIMSEIRKMTTLFVEAMM